MELLDPKNDYVFKRLFAESPDLLGELISAVRRDEPPVQVVEVMNPVILPEDLSGESIELDVLAELPKADRLRRMRNDSEEDERLGAGLPTPLRAWIAFLKHWKETEAMSDLADLVDGRAKGRQGGRAGGRPGGGPARRPEPCPGDAVPPAGAPLRPAA